jgi:hypothetical protein
VLIHFTQINKFRSSLDALAGHGTAIGWQVAAGRAEWLNAMGRGADAYQVGAVWDFLSAQIGKPGKEGRLGSQFRWAVRHVIVTPMRLAVRAVQAMLPGLVPLAACCQCGK